MWKINKHGDKVTFRGARDDTEADGIFIKRKQTFERKKITFPQITVHCLDKEYYWKFLSVLSSVFYI